MIAISRGLVAAATGLLLLGAGSRAPREDTVIYTVMMHPALDSLQLNVPAKGIETGWCVDDYTKNRVNRGDEDRADTMIRVFHITRAVTSFADRSNVDFFCPDGVPTIHSHPADDDGRVACDPSKIDRHSLTAHRRPFGIVWCAMPGTVTYRPYANPETDSLPLAVVGEGPPRDRPPAVRDH